MRRSKFALIGSLGISAVACAQILALPTETDHDSAEDGGNDSAVEASSEASSRGCGCADGVLCYCGGNILASPHYYLVYWGYDDLGSQSPAGTIVERYLHDGIFGGGSAVTGSRFLETVTQYTGHEANGADLVPVTNPPFISKLAIVADDTLASGPVPTPEELRTRAIAVQQQRGGGAQERDAIVIILKKGNADGATFAPQHARVSLPEGCDVPGGPTCNRPDIFYIALPDTPDTIAADLHRELTNLLTDPGNADGKGGWRLTSDGGSFGIGSLCPNRFIAQVYPITRAQAPEQIVLNEVWSASASDGKGGCVQSRATTLAAFRVDGNAILERVAHVDSRGPSGLQWGPDQTWLPEDGGAFKGNPTVIAWGPGRTDMFMLDENGGVRHGVNHVPDEKEAGFDDWGIAETNLPCTSALDATSFEPGRIDVFCRVDHSDGAPPNIMLRTFDSRYGTGKDLFAWTEVPAAQAWRATSAIAATSWHSTRFPAHTRMRERIDIFTMGTDKRFHHGSTEDAAKTWTWDGGGAGTIPAINGVPLELVGDPDASGWSEGRLDVVMRVSDGSYAHGWSDDEWATQTWESLGLVPCGHPGYCQFANDPSIADLGDGRFAIAGSALSVTSQGNTLWTRVYDFGLGPWNDSLIFAGGRIDLSSW